MSVPPFLTSPLLAMRGVRHAFFTRRGGASKGLYASLNVGRGSADDASAVAENLHRAALAFGMPESALTLCHQIHSAQAAIAPVAWRSERPQADAVVTAEAGIICGVLSADCAPILIVDPEARIVAAVHAGWKGALTGIVASAIEAMGSLGAEPGRMVAAIGPCIAQATYEVGSEFIDRFESEAPGAGRFFTRGDKPGKHQFDLAGFVASRLAAAGVRRWQWLARDTCAEELYFFSNRRAVSRGEPDYGRLLSAIVLEP